MIERPEGPHDAAKTSRREPGREGDKVEVTASFEESLIISTATFDEFVKRARTEIRNTPPHELAKRIEALKAVVTESRDPRAEEIWKIHINAESLLYTSESSDRVKAKLFHAGWMLTSMSAFSAMLAKISSGQTVPALVACGISVLSINVGFWSLFNVDFSRPLEKVYAARVRTLEALIREMETALKKRP
jgi:hypothetical protein